MREHALKLLGVSAENEVAEAHFVLALERCGALLYS